MADKKIKPVDPKAKADEKGDEKAAEDRKTSKRIGMRMSMSRRKG